MKHKKTLEPNELYIGGGNLTLRLPASTWALGPTINANSTELRVLQFAKQYLCNDGLPIIRKALRGVDTVICDCPPGKPCHGEVFVDAACNDWMQATDQHFRDAPGGATKPAEKQKTWHKIKRANIAHPATAFAAVANLPAAAAAIPHSPTSNCFWPQETIETAVRGLFPDHWLTDEFPWLENISQLRTVCRMAQARANHSSAQSNQHVLCMHSANIPGIG